MTDRFLPTPLRRALERTVKQAREVAEEAAADAIRRLGVAEAKPPAHLNERAQEARRRLRAHGRTLGDSKASDETQTTARLIEAAAYVHWHRRLFARFLAERGLLRHPVHNAAVTLEDCAEFASDEGFADEWDAAEAYAARMLPAVFQPEDPVLALEIAPEHAQALRKLVLGLDAETFQTEDALGWTYQFWRALEKDRVNKKGGKIGKDELPAVTQLFTEPYMVRFLLHNTLGAWRAGKVLRSRPDLAAGAADEAELRAAVSPPGYDFDMLRFVREGEDAPRWRPAAGDYPGWPQTAAALTVLDPCCGSGHFLTEALTILAAMRADEEGLSPADAVAAVLRDNLFGLELDGRCVQIAAFAVALSAWKIGGFQTLPSPHVAWVGAPPPLPRAEFEALGNGDPDLRRGLRALHDLFVQAPLLGSLIDPDRGDLADAHGALDFKGMLDKLIAKARRAEGDDDRREGVIAARGMADAAAILRGRYTLVATNVPFLGRGKQHPDLAAFVERTHKDAKTDLATAMLSRALNLLHRGGTAAAVTPQNWLFLGAYKRLRARLLEQTSLNLIGALGPRAFETISGEVVNTALVAFSAVAPQASLTFAVLDANSGQGAEDKRRSCNADQLLLTSQAKQLYNPDHRISLRERTTQTLLSEFAGGYAGVQSGDQNHWGRAFWELLMLDDRWSLQQTTVGQTTSYGGMHNVLLWERGEGALFKEVAERLGRTSAAAWLRGREAWGRKGVCISSTGELYAALYTGELNDANSATIIPRDESNLPAIWCYLSSRIFHDEVRAVDQALKVTNSTQVKVPFDLAHWTAVAAEKYPNGLPEPYSDDPTQWLFHGHPAQAEAGTQLHVALARLAGYRWPAESDPDMRLADEARDWIEKAQALPAADPDGLLALHASGTDRSLAERLREHLAAAFGADWSDGLERRLVAEADATLDKKTAKDGSLEAWLRDRAFRQHCRLFHDRPFLWQVWDGLSDGFSAFLHYHRLDRSTLQKLTYTVLNDWIARRRAESDDRRVESAMILQSKLTAILEGEAPYDIFVRWKPLDKQPLGWEPDLDDGVRLNIRPWIRAEVLRETPKIKWGVDRGTDVKSAPWYPIDHGKRNNDRHTTLAEKRAARAAASPSAA